MLSGEEPAVSKVKPNLTPSEREKLAGGGYLEIEKRGVSSHIILTDKVWECALNDLVVEGTRSPHASTVLQHLLKKLKEYLESHDISLAEFLRSQNGAIAEVNITIAPPNLKEKVREAYLEISGGSYNVRVRLSELRTHLGDLPRTEIDKTLGEMELAGQLSLMPLDDPQEIHSEDEKAAIDMGGPKRHILYMKG
nr:hypothetical protein [Leptolyngbya sp. FACHB-711]